LPVACCLSPVAWCLFLSGRAHSWYSLIMAWLARSAAALTLLAPLMLGGCKQGIGDRCQVMSDCDDGLICVLPAGGTPQAGGTCQAPGGGDMAVPPADLELPSPGG
jgi:hypothetical protein